MQHIILCLSNGASRWLLDVSFIIGVGPSEADLYYSAQTWDFQNIAAPFKPKFDETVR